MEPPLLKKILEAVKLNMAAADVLLGWRAEQTPIIFLKENRETVGHYYDVHITMRIGYAPPEMRPDLEIDPIKITHTRRCLDYEGGCICKDENGN